VNRRPVILWTLTGPPPRVSQAPGLVFLHIPLIKLESVSSAVDRERLEECQSAIITSRFAVSANDSHLQHLGNLPCYAIGAATRDHLVVRGIASVEIPLRATAHDLVELLRGQPPLPPVYFPRGDLGGETVLAYLRAAGLPHYSPVVYRNLKRSRDDILRNYRPAAQPVAVALGSPSAVEMWQRVGPDFGADIPIATLGPSTSRTCRQAGLAVWQEAASPLLKMLVESCRINAIMLAQYTFQGLNLATIDMKLGAVASRENKATLNLVHLIQGCKQCLNFLRRQGIPAPRIHVEFLVSNTKIMQRCEARFKSMVFLRGHRHWRCFTHG